MNDRMSPAGPELPNNSLIPVLFTHFGDQWIRGSETLLLDLLRNINLERFRPIVWCNGIELSDVCRAAGYQTHRTDFAFYFDHDSPRFDLANYLRLIQEGLALARHYKVRVLHANSAAPTQWLLPVARKLRLPLLSHLHIDYLRRARYTMMLHQADLIVGVSKQVLDEFLADGVPSSRTQVIYNGIDFARLDSVPGSDLRPRLNIPAGARVIGAAGSLVRRKGHDVLIRAMALLTGEQPHHLLIASDGPERSSLERLAADLSVSRQVHFLGYHPAITDVYRSCDIMVLASRADAFGLVLAEAGYSRRPVVATRVGGIPEVVIDGGTGLLIPPDDPRALAAALQTLVDDEALCEQLGSAGRVRAQTHFSVQRMASDFQDTYERLLARPRRSLGWRSLPGRAFPVVKLLAPRIFKNRRH